MKKNGAVSRSSSSGVPSELEAERDDAEIDAAARVDAEQVRRAFVLQLDVEAGVEAEEQLVDVDHRRHAEA